MKNIFLILVCSLISVSALAESRTFAKVDANHATVTIVTDAAQGTQAAVYVDAAENKQFVDMLLADPTSDLSKIKYALEEENCQAHSTPDNSWIPECGEVEVTGYVMTSYGRGGWMEAGAGYTYFVGFRQQDTGHFFDSEYMVLVVENVAAETDDQGEFNGTLIKTLAVSKITELPKSK